MTISTINIRYVSTRRVATNRITASIPVIKRYGDIPSLNNTITRAKYTRTDPISG